MKQGLEKSIKSLISQNEKDSVEYIVIDGLSTDGSQDIIQKYKDYIDIYLGSFLNCVGRS